MVRSAHSRLFYEKKDFKVVFGFNRELVRRSQNGRNMLPLSSPSQKLMLQHFESIEGFHRSFRTTINN